MKISKILMVTVVALVICSSNFVSAKDSAKFSVAVVDAQKIIDNSPQISALKTDRKNKLADLVKFVEKAKADLAKQTDATKKKTLEDKYNKQLNEKKQAIDKEYAKKLADIDKSITKTINLKSTEYDLVLTKNIVLKGGTDITSEIIKELK